jgi:hypothetical protein
MKKGMFFLGTILVTSCGAYVDINRENINTNNLDFNYLKEKNEFIYKSKINASADTEIYYTTKFSLSLPKKIINWYQSNNEFYFEYDSKQLIYISSGYKNVGQEVDWYMTDFKQQDVFSIFNYYWNKRNYNESYLHKTHNNRLTKLYTNGKVKVLLYNIKKENYERFVENIKSFKYIE